MLALGLVPGTTISSNNQISIPEGSINIITCESVGYPPPTVIWNRNNGALSGGVSINNTVSTLVGDGNITRVSRSLIITNASREDTGVYTCSGSNFIGSDNKTVSITVQCKFIMQNILLMTTLLIAKKGNMKSSQRKM